MELLINLIEAISMTWFLMSLLIIRNHKKQCAFVLIITNFLVITISNYIMFYDIFLMSLVIIINTFLLKYFTQNELHEILFISCLESLYLCFIGWSVIFISKDFPILGSLISRLLYIVLGYFVIAFLKNKKLYFTKNLYYLLSLNLFGLQFFISHTFQIYLFFEQDYPEYNISLIMFEIIIIGFLYLLIRMSDLCKSKLSYERLTQEKANEQVLSALYEEVRITKHDLKNVYHLLSHYIQQNKIAEINKMISTKSEELKDIPILINSPNDLINTVINHKQIRAYTKKLETQCDIVVDENIFINDYDLNDLLSNILDNAIDNCKDNGKIEIKLRQDKQYLFICVTNSILEKSDLQTKKLDKKNHGIGLKSIERIAKKYEGHVRIEQSDTQFTIYVTLLLNFNK